MQRGTLLQHRQGRFLRSSHFRSRRIQHPPLQGLPQAVAWLQPRLLPLMVIAGKEALFVGLGWVGDLFENGTVGLLMGPSGRTKWWIPSFPLIAKTHPNFSSQPARSFGFVGNLGTRITLSECSRMEFFQPR